MIWEFFALSPLLVLSILFFEEVMRLHPANFNPLRAGRRRTRAAYFVWCLATISVGLVCFVSACLRTLILMGESV